MNRLFLLLFGMVTFVAHAQVPDYVPTEGLVAWYPFNGNANDESGNGNDGVVDGASLTDDRFLESAKAYSFDGFNDFIDCGNAPSVQISGALTYSAWIEVDAYTNFSGVVGRGEGTGGSKAISMLMITNSDNKSLRFEISEGIPYESVTSPTETILQSAWTHVVGVWFGPDADSMAVFVDGQLSASAPSVTNEITGGTDANDNLLKIGNRDRYSSGYSYGWFDGKIDDVGVWNRALTEEEILTLYNATAPAPGCTDTTACNFDAEATSDDGSCIPSGCMEPLACNYNALAECASEACDYTCCPGPGCCSAGMYWDYDVEQCMNYETCQDDLDGDGVIGVNDLMQLLSSFGTDCAPAEEPESAEWSCGDPVNYYGYDYSTILIGEQCWFAENLRSENYANGDAIPANLSDSGWSSTTSGAVAVYGEGDVCNNFSPDIDSCDPSQSLNEYGRLYNGYAVEDSRGLCPSDWHIPTDGDWSELTFELGGESTAGQQLKSHYGWYGGENGTNSSGFSGLPGGYRHINGAFDYTGYGGSWWGPALGAVNWYRTLYYNNEAIFINYSSDQRSGFSVRCLKDSE